MSMGQKRTFSAAGDIPSARRSAEAFFSRSTTQTPTTSSRSWSPTDSGSSAGIGGRNRHRCGMAPFADPTREPGAAFTQLPAWTTASACRRGGDDRLRVLFFAYRRGIASNYGSLVSELSERGHEVHLAFESKRGLLPRRPLPPRVSSGFAPERGKFDGWRSLAWLVRAIGDLARYTHPRYERAPVLRRRMRRLVMDRLETPSEFDPIARRVALRVARKLVGTSDADL